MHLRPPVSVSPTKAMRRVDGIDHEAGGKRLGKRQHNASTVAHSTGHSAVEQAQTGSMVPPRPQGRGGAGAVRGTVHPRVQVKPCTYAVTAMRFGCAACTFGRRSSRTPSL